MSSVKRVAVVFAVVISFVFVIAAPQAAKQKAELEAVYKQMDALREKRNIAGLMVYLSSDFKLKTMDGQELGRKQAEAAMKGALSTFKSIDDATTKVKSVAISKSDTIVNSESKLTATAVDEKKKSHKWVITTQTKDTWNKTSKGWRIKRVVELSTRIMVDGRAIAMPARIN
jgi:hypothetical protein